MIANSLNPLLAEIRALTHLAAPVAISQVGMLLMSVVDIMMVGHVSDIELGAVALGNTYAFAFIIVAIGTLMGLDPIVSQAFGARRFDLCGEAAQRGFVLAVWLTAPLVLLFAITEPLLLFIGEPPLLAERAAAYVHALIPGMLPFLIYVATRQFLQGLGMVRPAMVVVVAANLVNAGVNWALIFGHFGFPAMGAEGAGFATSFSRLFMAVALVGYALRSDALKNYPWRLTRSAWRLRPLIDLTRRSFPIGLQYGIEIWAFTAVTMLMGWLSTHDLAGHQIALNLLALSFMIPVGLANAAAIRVGHAIGRGDLPAARLAALASLTLVLFTATVAATLLGALAHPLAHLYTNVPAIAAAAAHLIPLAALAQFADGIQGVGFGILRGAADTRFPFIINVVGYWVVGLPIGYLMTFHGDFGPRGLWWGLGIGLTLVAVLILVRIRSTMRSSRTG